MGERFKLPPVITASSWPAIWGAVWERAKQARGVDHDEDGTVAPVLTNREAIAIVLAMRELPTAERWPLWYQFAAVAYGWDPYESDRLDTTRAQADKLYPPETTVALILEMQRMVGEIDNATAPRMALKSDTFEDTIVQGDVAAALKQDGGISMQGFPIPTGKCTDKKTGKKRPIRPKCDKDGKGPIEPNTRRRMKCDNPGDCEPEVLDVDPAKALIKFVAVVAMVAIGALALENWMLQPRHDRRRRL
jgi:hypothetical protein